MRYQGPDVFLGLPLNENQHSFRTLNKVFTQHKIKDNLPESIFNMNNSATQQSGTAEQSLQKFESKLEATTMSFHSTTRQFQLKGKSKASERKCENCL